MEITRTKFWTKTVSGENVEHVQICYDDGDSKHVLHQFDKCAIAAPEFYDSFHNLPIYICKICGLDESLKNGIFVRDVTIAKSEDKEGNETTVYKMICNLKAGHASVTFLVSCQHKFIPEGFAQAIKTLVDESKEYVNGKREQVDLFDKQIEPETDGEEQSLESEDNNNTSIDETKEVSQYCPGNDEDLPDFE